MNTKPNLRNYTEKELISIMESLGEKAFRGKQISNGSIKVLRIFLK